MQRLTVVLTPEFEKAMKKKETLVKELELVEQEGKAYVQQLEGMKVRFAGRLGQISGVLNLNSKRMLSCCAAFSTLFQRLVERGLWRLDVLQAKDQGRHRVGDQGPNLWWVFCVVMGQQIISC